MEELSEETKMALNDLSLHYLITRAVSATRETTIRLIEEYYKAGNENILSSGGPPFQDPLEERSNGRLIREVFFMTDQRIIINIISGLEEEMRRIRRDDKNGNRILSSDSNRM